MRPFQDFGIALKAFRVAADESIEDVSGAVEIEPIELTKIEGGEARPPQDILELLITHFALRETEAARLWELAQYENTPITPEAGAVIQEVQITFPSDGRAFFTDTIQIASNQYGIILTFLQANDKKQSTVVSRVGMSQQHAESMLKLLAKALKHRAEEPGN